MADSTPAPGLTPDAAPTTPVAAPTPGVLNEAQAAVWRSRIDRAKRKRSDFAQEWSTNVDYRRGKQFDTESDVDRVAVAIDWSQTKAKQAQLFSQVPQVQLTPKHQMFAPAIPVFARKLNDTITMAGVGAAMDECLADVINAAGVGAVIVGYESRQEIKSVPKPDTALMPPEAVAAIQAQPDLMTDVKQIKDARFYCRRISPGELLWPTEFRQSDWNLAPWLGYSGRMTWAEAKQTLKIGDDKKQDVLGASTPNTSGTGTSGSLSLSPLDQKDQEQDVVEFDELYYWAYLYDPTCYSFCKVRRVVFVRGIDAPVIDEDYAGQSVAQDGSYYVGVCELPIKVLTLTYISDEAIPPSDTAIGRPQVDELIRFRSQLIQQMKHSLPMRWFDVNRADRGIIDRLMKGDWQGLVPVNGDGTKALGEVARASHPPENFEINRIINNDLTQSWQIGPNQQGAFNQGERSASEAQIVQQNFSTRIGYERARVGSFFVSIARVLAGLLAMFGTFDTPDIGQDGQQRLQAWNRQAIGNCFVYDIRADSTVLLDAGQRMQKLSHFLDLTAKSGYVNVEPVIREMAALAGLDPDMVVQKPAPKGPEPPQVSIKVDSETVRDPIILAMLVHGGYAPGPQDMEAGKQILINKVSPPESVGPHSGAALGAPPPDPTKPGGPGAPPALPAAIGRKLPAPPVDDPTPKWNLADRVNKRMNDGSNA